MVGDFLESSHEKLEDDMHSNTRPFTDLYALDRDCFADIYPLIPVGPSVVRICADGFFSCNQSLSHQNVPYQSSVRLSVISDHHRSLTHV